MKVGLERRDDCIVLHLQGEFDSFYCGPFLEKLEQLMAEGEQRVALNMRKVKFINSTALGTIIKASKMLAAEKGKLVVSSPSTFCKSTMESIGLPHVVPLLADDDEAVKLLRGAAPPRKVAAREVDLVKQEESAVLFYPVEEAHLEAFIPEELRKQATNPVHGHTFGVSWRGVGRMLAVDSDGLRFAWDGGASALQGSRMVEFLAPGTELQIKFRLPLFEKGRSEARVMVQKSDVEGGVCHVEASFTEIHASTLEAVEQYAKDMAYLKQELRQATDGKGKKGGAS